jgi:hypothetical protein
MKDQLTLELKQLKAQERNRILIISGLMVAGAATGFLISRKMKARMAYQILSGVGASFAFGLPYLLITRKNSLARREKIKVNTEALNVLNAPVKSVDVKDIPKEVRDTATQLQQNLKNFKPF